MIICRIYLMISLYIYISGLHHLLGSPWLSYADEPAKPKRKPAPKVAQRKRSVKQMTYKTPHAGSPAVSLEPLKIPLSHLIILVG